MKFNFAVFPWLKGNLVFSFLLSTEKGLNILQVCFKMSLKRDDAKV